MTITGGFVIFSYFYLFYWIFLTMENERAKQPSYYFMMASEEEASFVRKVHLFVSLIVAT